MPTPKHEVKDLIAAGLHFGHKTAKWNPKMKPYIYGQKNGIHIFDAQKTADGLTAACAYLTKMAAAGKVIMLISTKQQTLDIMPDIAHRLGLPYATEKWFGGMLTNWATTKARIKELRDLKTERDETAFSKYVKSERNRKIKQIERLELWLSGIEGLDKLPDVVFVLDTARDSLAVTEARLRKIPVVGMCDSNADPDTVDYPIPGNDDAVKAIDYVLTAVANAIEEGQKNPAKVEKKEEKAAPKKEEKPAAADDEGKAEPAKEEAKKEESAEEKKA